MKFWKKASLQKKMLSICMMIVLVSVFGFAGVGVWHTGKSFRLLQRSDRAQSTVIKDHSRESMMAVTEQNLKLTIAEAAGYSEGEFWTYAHDLDILSRQVEDVFRHPERYGEVEVYPPDPANAGKMTLQLLVAEDVDKTDRNARSQVKKLANLAPMMTELVVGDENVTDCYIALPSGYTLVMDDKSEGKFDENGNLKPYDARSRSWYQGAMQVGDTYFTPATNSYYYGWYVTNYGLPVYVDGELVAVLEGSTRLERIQQWMSKLTYGETGFLVMFDNAGQFIYSPRTEGDLALSDSSCPDIRQRENADIAHLYEKAQGGETGFDEVLIDGEDYYCAYAPVPTLHGAVMMFVSTAEVEQPTESLLADMDRVGAATMSEYGASMRHSVVFTLVMTAILVLLAFIAADRFSVVLVRPINVMTKSVEAVRGDNLDFEMKSVYKTGDEIEVLAGAFGDLAERTQKYITEIREFTAEKERLGTELALAAQIQSDMLPEFPMFTDRSEFSVYATMNPAKEVGGDFFDVFMTDEEHLCLVIADVAGKGIPASLYMVVSQTLIKNRAKVGGTPAEIAKDVNEQLCQKRGDAMFVTVWFAMLDLATGRLVEVNAGHECPVLKKNGTYTVIDRPHSFALGGLEKMKYTEDELFLAPGDMVFVCTDGLTEARNPENKMFGMNRVVETLNRHETEEPEELLCSIRGEVDTFVEGVPQYDDLTMLAIIYHGKGGNNIDG